MSRAPADWYADPSGRYPLRWWDGRAWSDTVLTRGDSRQEHRLPAGARDHPPPPPPTPNPAPSTGGPAWGRVLIGATAVLLAAWLLTAWGQTLGG